MAKNANHKLVILDAEGDDIELPSHYAVCESCQGKGVHDHPAFSNGITAEEWNGPDWDEDSQEDYMNGAYDVPCSECKGQRVVLVADEDAMDDEEKAAWAAHLEDMHQLYAAERPERYLMGDY